MPLSVGTKLGPYEILAPIGAGGMGEVYKGRDPRLDRNVAIKISAAQFSERFEREAKAIAALNHPNICQIYDVGPNYLVMEYIDGAPLRGPLPLDQVLKYATQICDALDAAHQKGITHRDLKPANILRTKAGVIKLLDFGLAKLRTPRAGQTPEPGDATLTMALTGKNEIVGTLYYMSPEQLQAQATGKEIDGRSDLFSFGGVLYEMLTGKRAFEGSSPASVIAAIKERPAPSIVDVAPATLDWVLKRCLEKDPNDRWQTARDLRAQFERIASSAESESAFPAAANQATRLRWLWPGAASLAIVCALGVSFLHFRETPLEVPALRLSVQLPDKFQVGYFALSPDGSTLAITPASGAKSQIWLRALDSLDLRPLANTDGARHPFWSPDSRSIGFFAGGKIKIIPASGGPATPLCDSDLGNGGAWSRAGVILFATLTTPIQRVNAAGGACNPLTQIEPGVRHIEPAFLPDGKHFLYLLQDNDQGNGGLYLAALDQPAGRRLLPDPSSAIFVSRRNAKSHDHLLFERENTLMAQPFDAGTLQLAGDVFPVAPQFSRTLGGLAASAARNGTLVYLAGSSRDQFQPTWLDRSGNELGKVGPLGYQRAITLSPDQKTVALGYTPVGSRQGRWLRDLVRDVETPFAAAPFLGTLVWSPDGSRLAFSRPTGVYVKNAGGGPEELVLSGRGQIRLSDWSRDGKYLLYTDNDPKTRGDIWVLAFDSSSKPGTPVVFLKTEFNETEGQFSPDGHWVAYVSNESGGNEVYVRPFPSGGGAIRISNSGGIEPRWRGNGEELYYLVGGNPAKLMAVFVKSRPSGPPEIGVPKALFEWHTNTVTTEANYFSYSPSADGQRFLMNVLPDATLPTLNVITNWENAAAAK